MVWRDTDANTHCSPCVARLLLPLMLRFSVRCREPCACTTAGRHAPVRFAWPPFCSKRAPRMNACLPCRRLESHLCLAPAHLGAAQAMLGAAQAMLATAPYRYAYPSLYHRAYILPHGRCRAYRLPQGRNRACRLPCSRCCTATGSWRKFDFDCTIAL